MRFSKSGEISIIFDVNREAKILFELFSDVEIMPVKITEPDGNIALDNARHGDGARFNTRNTEVDADLLTEVFVELALVLNSGKFNGM